MKLFGRFQEMSLNQIYLYGTPIEAIKEIIADHPEIEVTVKEHRPKKSSKDIISNELKMGGKAPIKEKIVYHPDYAKRHQVVLVNELGFLKIILYSQPLDSKDIERCLNLKSIPSVAKKEKMELAIAKLNPAAAHERQYYAERVKVKRND